MSRARPAIAGSPVFVGAVTVLVTIVAVFLAYNANSGLPFVPTYDLRAQLPSGAKLVAGNDVRIGGFRVGIVERIRPGTVELGGRPRAIAVADLKLDGHVRPLPRDSTLVVRPRSVFGLKYIELTPGDAPQGFRPGATIPLEQASVPPDLEDVLATFDGETRADARAAVEQAGDAFAGRGLAVNEAVGELPRFLAHLEPVMRILSAPDTQLDRFVRELAGTTAQLQPVAATAAALFGHGATVMAALSRDREALGATIERGPGALAAGTSALSAARPLVDDLAALSRELTPAARELDRALPRIDTTLVVGAPVLERSPALSDRVRSLAGELEVLLREPTTELALRDLRDLLAVARPAIEYVAPYQTVCNYFVYFVLPLGEHQSQPAGDGSGTVQNQGVKSVNLLQANNYATTENSRPVDIDPGTDPIGARDAFGQPLHRFYAQPYQPAIDAQGNADCQIGQNGYMRGPLAPSFARYPRGVLSDGTPTGANWGVGLPQTPGLSGGTYVTRELGIDNLEDVP